MRTYTAVVERCPDTHLFVGYVPNFPGAHSQGETLDELYGNLREVIEMLHRGRDISPILLRQIAREIGLTVDELLSHGQRGQ